MTDRSKWHKWQPLRVRLGHNVSQCKRCGITKTCLALPGTHGVTTIWDTTYHYFGESLSRERPECLGELIQHSFVCHGMNHFDSCACGVDRLDVQVINERRVFFRRGGDQPTEWENTCLPHEGLNLLRGVAND